MTLPDHHKRQPHRRGGRPRQGRGGAQGGEAAAEGGTYHLVMRAKTVAAGKPTTLSVSPQTDGPVVVSGNIAADAGQQLRVAQISDPPAFARTALIEALRRAEVSVSASSTGSNPSSELPKKGSYNSEDQVAVTSRRPSASTPS